ncbi:hypothetical protein [uncultured Bacteroides sp.]|uniref:hypothetical protein n=1 Tax=uncultured Bacteroides sp. TaxID=162156 RepID=UPI002AABCCD5|nr:hypothetical protein [uncultured Bacteroides sp.]
MANELISRLHTPEFETDYYKILGTTSLEKYTSDFQKNDWKEDFWTQYESGILNISNQKDKTLFYRNRKFRSPRKIN